MVESEMVLPTHMKFKKIQMYDKYPKGQARVRWKHLKQLLPAENYQNYPPDEPNCEFLLSYCELLVVCLNNLCSLRYGVPEFELDMSLLALPDY